MLSLQSVKRGTIQINCKGYYFEYWKNILQNEVLSKFCSPQTYVLSGWLMLVQNSGRSNGCHLSTVGIWIVFSLVSLNDSKQLVPQMNRYSSCVFNSKLIVGYLNGKTPVTHVRLLHTEIKQSNFQRIVFIVKREAPKRKLIKRSD